MSRKTPEQIRDHALIRAAHKGNYIDCERLIAQGADVNARSESFFYKGCTPANLAVWKNGGDIIRLLARHGADLDLFDKDGYNPLLTALVAEKHIALAALLECGADPYAVNHKGTSAYDYAVKKGKAAVVEMFRNCPAATRHLPPVAQKKPEDDNKTLFRHVLGERVMEEYYDFAAQERITLVINAQSGLTEKIQRDDFTDIDAEKLVRAFNQYAARGGDMPEDQALPRIIRKKRLNLPPGDNA